MSKNPPMCLAGCGFFGSAATNGLCSKCFKDKMKKEGQPIVSRTIPSFSSAHISNPAMTDTHTASNCNTAVGKSPKENSTGSPKETIAQPDAAPQIDPLIGAMMSNIGALSRDAPPITPQLKPSIDKGNTVGEGSGASGNDKKDASSEKKKNRCHVCNKRVGLTGFTCRCGGLYCSLHRYDKEHQCQYDYKTVQREELRKKNPMVVSDKIARI